MSFISYLAAITGVVGAFALLPQVIKIYKHKSARDISLVSSAFLFFGALVWVAYGIEQKSLPLILGNSMGGINCALIIFGCLKYGKGKRSQ